jgi:hypothetical protein
VAERLKGLAWSDPHWASVLLADILGRLVTMVLGQHPGLVGTAGGSFSGMARAGLIPVLWHHPVFALNRCTGIFIDYPKTSFVA